jgi:hypothetical protein
LQGIYIGYDYKIFLHWSKELRIKNTTGKRLPAKVAVSVYMPCQFIMYICRQYFFEPFNTHYDMEANSHNPGNEIQVELAEDIAQGTYVNLAIIAHSSSEFIIDFIRMVPGVPKAKVKSRVILTPDNAKRLLYALEDNIRKFEEQKGTAESYDKIIPTLSGIKGEA